MRISKGSDLILAVAAGLVFSAPLMAQEPDKSTTKTTQAAEASTTKNSVESGRKQKVSGIIVKRDGDKIVVRDRSKTETTVSLGSGVKISERKKNPFRGAKQYDDASLVRGLWVEVEGRGDSGNLVAEKIKFTDEEFRDASSLETRVDPVEDRVTDTEGRMTQAEQNAQRLSGQLEELAAVANTAKGGAKAAQETADKALSEANAANEKIVATNQKVSQVEDKVNVVDNRVNSLDDYEAKNTLNVVFKVGSATITKDMKTALDELATQALAEKGYVIQVAGFASADGDKGVNRRLSERRADAVIRYLIDNHDIPQRRIITPYGYGENKPVGDNATREGRKENRRVEVAILVSKGLVGSTTAGGSASSTSNVPQQ